MLQLNDVLRIKLVSLKTLRETQKYRLWCQNELDLYNIGSKLFDNQNVDYLYNEHIRMGLKPRLTKQEMVQKLNDMHPQYAYPDAYSAYNHIMNVTYNGILQTPIITSWGGSFASDASFSHLSILQKELENGETINLLIISIWPYWSLEKNPTDPGYEKNPGAGAWFQVTKLMNIHKPYSVFLLSKLYDTLYPKNISIPFISGTIEALYRLKSEQNMWQLMTVDAIQIPSPVPNMERRLLSLRTKIDIEEFKHLPHREYGTRGVQSFKFKEYGLTILKKYANEIIIYNVLRDYLIFMTSRFRDLWKKLKTINGRVNQLCNICYDEALYSCGDCQQQYYCGQKCAQMDWQWQHRKTCNKF